MNEAKIAEDILTVLVLDLWLMFFMFWCALMVWGFFNLLREDQKNSVPFKAKGRWWR